MDLPGWQAIYEELKPHGFEIIAAAQDTGGEAAAGSFYDRAKATYATLLDPKHTISSLYGMVNVPTGVWIDEEGRMVRPPEVAYSTDVRFYTLRVDGKAYVAGLRDWVKKGPGSIYAMKPDEIARKLAARTRAEDQADVHFRLGALFKERGDEARAKVHWAEAQRLNPESWNYHRQDWSYSPADATFKFMRKVGQQGGKPYYPPLDLPKPEDEKKKTDEKK